MKVAIVNRHPADFLGGSETQCDNIAACLTTRGHDVTYIAPSGAERSYERNYNVVPVPPLASAIVSAINKADAEIVYWRFNKYQWYRSARAISAQRIPLVFAVSHINDTRRISYLENPWSSARQFGRAVKQACLSVYNYQGFRYADALTSLNPDYLGKIPLDNQMFVPNSVDETISPFEWSRPYLVWVSNLKPPKRPELFIKLYDELEYLGIDFLMVGDILSAEYNYVRTMNSRGNFYFLGKKTLKEVNGILAGAIALVHTCKTEGFGNNFIQAWKVGTPSVSLSFDPGGYIAKNDLGGYAGGSWEKFKSRVREIVENEELRNGLGANAKNFSNEFSVERTTDIIEELFEGLTASNRARS